MYTKDLSQYVCDIHLSNKDVRALTGEYSTQRKRESRQTSFKLSIISKGTGAKLEDSRNSRTCVFILFSGFTTLLGIFSRI